MLSITGSVVFITGANRAKGIGRALVDEAIKRGAKKVYATARDISQLDELVARHAGKVVPIELDVTNLEHIKRAAHLASDTQVLINNAGWAGNSGCVRGYDEQVARNEMEINYFGPMRIINVFSQHLLKNGNAAIVNIVSIGAFTPAPMHITYSAAKTALYSLTTSLRLELRGCNLPVFGAYPGPIDTDMAEEFNVQKASPESVAVRIFAGMEAGLLDITTDVLSDLFINRLKPDVELIMALKKHYGV